MTGEKPRRRSRCVLLCLCVVAIAAMTVLAQGSRDPDWSRLESETLRHFLAVLRLDTSNPPGNEVILTDYLKEVLQQEGIPVQIFARDPNRPNLVARLKGNGKKQPILFMGHTDVVTVDPKKWSFPPFSATRDGGYIYGRGSLDDKPHIVAGLMLLLELKRLNVPLDRDVIFLAESGEEGTTEVGIDFMTREHADDIRAEYCLAEGGNVTRVGGKVKFAPVQTMEKVPRPIELVATGPSGHASVPLKGNAVARLSAAVAALDTWRPPIRLNTTTREYFTRMAAISPGAAGERYRAILTPDSRAAAAADAYFLEHEPRHASMLRTSLSPTIVQGGYRVNVIPSEARATIDVRMVPEEDPVQFLEVVRKVINDAAVSVTYAPRAARPIAPAARLDSPAFQTIETFMARNYDTIVLPTMGTGATDMAQVRSIGAQCYGIGPAVDFEDVAKGYGAHSDQERILEAEVHRFVRFAWDVVVELARSK